MYKLKLTNVSAFAQLEESLSLAKFLRLWQVEFSVRQRKKQGRKAESEKIQTKTKRAKTNHKRQPQLHTQVGIQCKLCSEVPGEMAFMAVISFSPSPSVSFSSLRLSFSRHSGCLSFRDRRIVEQAAEQFLQIWQPAQMELFADVWIWIHFTTNLAKQYNKV